MCVLCVLFVDGEWKHEGFLSGSVSKPPSNFKFHKNCEDIGLNHLCFADDLFLFCLGDVTFVKWLKSCLDGFYRVSGLQVSEDKSCIYFSSGHEALRGTIIRACGFSLRSLPVKYLGIPFISTRLKKSHCLELVDKLTDMLNSLEVRSLSYATSDAYPKRESKVSKVYINGQWRLSLLGTRQIEDAWNHITSTNMEASAENKIEWIAHPSGSYTIASVYDVLRSKAPIVN
ncbi:uncharacterized protein [Rutidosis leptorrhynchoides]|uniref:uncharacterized protein n=1 Tax=Rutidosis leptorrhynchoides TaxID=125765 RepID=UPI003A9951C9